MIAVRITRMMNKKCHKDENSDNKCDETVLLRTDKDDDNLKKHSLMKSTSQQECPLNKSELGNKTWGFLHTMAAYFPEQPTAQDTKDMAQFLRLFSKFYPCPTCARDFTKLIESSPPATSSQADLKNWLCWAHNEVNKKLGKPVFDCSKIDERWKFGWNDGSCN